MARKLQYRKLLLLGLLLGAAFGGLGYRLVDLQCLRHDELSAKAESNTRREFVFEPRRGDILDVKGNVLATSTFAKTVCADPSLMNERQADIVARTLAPLLQLNDRALFQRLATRTRLNDKGETNLVQYVRIKQRVPMDAWVKIEAALTNLSFGVDEKKLNKTDQAAYRAVRQKAIFAEDYPVRVYPNQSLAAHILGYAQTEDVEINSNVVSEIVGTDGIEKTMDDKLSGVPGWRLTETDRRGRELVSLRQQDLGACDGLNVVLTIDSVIQNIMETALADAMEKHTPISITGIAIRPKTGEILAMATLPNFNPNNPGASSADARRDRVVTDVVEPGSVFKIVVISGALNDHLVTLNEMFDCENGHFPYAGRILHDHEPYGQLSVEQIITKSSNIGAAKVGIKMGEDRLYNYISSYGFGARTGLPLPGEVIGISRPVKDWSKVSVAQIPMGQGIAVTRLQMAMAMCAIANDGVLMRPMLVNRLEDSSGNVVVRYSPQSVRRIISEDADKQMIEALKTVVSSEGTAVKAAMEHYTVAGKTGTAQKVEGGGYVHGKYIASFIGFFPADNPELCISIVLDEPKEGYYGGQVAGPVFKEIAERAANYLNIRPDIDYTATGQPDVLAQAADSRPNKSPVRAQ
ncbi:MAG TPA: penicillin-binding protein 2 [Verrucomicrobiae bacterium]|jgi:cell division protein FtsI/penicillin-binding protein 2|nr:penicillin-binding protein 2 [Verrucomicrobiae bacterium]